MLILIISILVFFLSIFLIRWIFKIKDISCAVIETNEKMDCLIEVLNKIDVKMFHFLAEIMKEK